MGAISDLLVWLERSRSRRRMLRLQDDLLADLGCSRALLEEGVRAWPWRTTDDTMAGLGRFRFPVGFRHAYGAPENALPPPRGRRQDARPAAAVPGLGRELQPIR